VEVEDSICENNPLKSIDWYGFEQKYATKLDSQEHAPSQE